MKKYLALIALTLSLTACVSSYETFDKTGNAATFIQCPLAQPWLCFNRAKETCPTGYRIVAQEGAFSWFDSNRSITIVCKSK